VIDSRIQPELIEESKPLLLDLLMQLLHLLADVRGSDEIAAELQAYLGNMNVQKSRDIAYHYV